MTLPPEAATRASKKRGVVPAPYPSEMQSRKHTVKAATLEPQKNHQSAGCKGAYDPITPLVLVFSIPI